MDVDVKRLRHPRCPGKVHRRDICQSNEDLGLHHKDLSVYPGTPCDLGGAFHNLDASQRASAANGGHTVLILIIQEKEI